MSLWRPYGDLNTLWPRQNGHHFADDTLKRIFLNENDRISIKISPKFVSKVPINYIQSLVQIMAWRRPGDKPLSEPMVVWLLTYTCIARPQWVNFQAARRPYGFSATRTATSRFFSSRQGHRKPCVFITWLWTLFQKPQHHNPTTTPQVYRKVIVPWPYGGRKVTNGF